MKKTLLLTIFLAGLIPLWGVNSAQYQTGVTGEQKNITGDEPSINVPYVPTPPGAITVSPGEIVGYTQYDFQSNGSTGTRVVVDAAGGKHFTWTNAITYPSPRHIYYNYLSPGGSWLAPAVGVQVNADAGAGFTQMDVLASGRSTVTYHQAALNFVTLAVEDAAGGGVFTLYDPPDMLALRCYWPYIAVDRTDRIHLVFTENTTAPQAIGYSRSVDGGVTWSGPDVVDTVRTVSPIIVASPVSNRVAILYSHPIDINYTVDNDVYYIISEDGTTWDFANGKVNVTNYEGDIDSFRVYADLDAVFDYDDNLQVIWNAGRMTSGGGITYRNWLWHYNGGTGMINLIAEQPTESWTCSPDAWSLGLAKPSIAASQDGGIFATWTRYDTSDYSATGYCNGEIYMSYSPDGTAWAPQIDLTNSHTPACAAGDCDADNWSSLAEQVDSNLYLFYVNDKDAGARPQNQGASTDNPVLYLAIPNPLYVAPQDRVEGLAESGDFTQIGVSNYGILGFYDTQNYTYNWHSRGAKNYEASFVLGNSGSTMIIEYGIGTGTHGFRARTDLDLTDTFHPTTAFDDSGLYNGLYVDYRGYGFTGAARQDIFIHEYIITNTSLAPVTGLYAGNYFDWDVGTTDVVTFDRAHNVIIQGPTAGPFFGVEVVSGSVNTLMGVSQWDYIYDQQGWVGDTLYYYMGQSADLMPFTYDDMSSLASFGPFDLEPAQAETLAFAIIGGSARDSISVRAALAQEIYDLFYVANVGVAPLTLSHTQNPDETVTYPADFSISNTGGVALTYTAAPTLPWITLGGVTGSIAPGGADPIDLIVNTTGITPGTYYDSVTVSSNDPDAPVLYLPLITITVEQAGCAYISGDFNGDGNANGIDVGAMVNFFKTQVVPPSADSCVICIDIGLNMLFPGGDANGDCNFNGIDVGYTVNHFKNWTPENPVFPFLTCPQCPPAGGPAPAVIRPGLKVKAVKAGSTE